MDSMRTNSRLVRRKKKKKDSLPSKRDYKRAQVSVFSGEGQRENLPRIFVTIRLIIIHHFHNRSVLHLHNVNNFIIHGSL